MAMCSDGTLAGWGFNGFAQLGDGTSNASNVPVQASTAGMAAGDRFTSILGPDSGDYFLGMVAPGHAPALRLLGSCTLLIRILAAL